MKLSIITINFNNQDGLSRTIESVVPLRSLDIEYIVIDGGSNDKSVDVILQNERFIDEWISESDTGIYNAMNKGILKAKGEYLLFLNSGDIISSQEYLISILSDLSVFDLIYADLIIKGDNEFIKIYPDVIDLKYMLEDSLPHPASFIKKSLFDRVGLYKESLNIIADWAFFVDAILKYDISYKHINSCFSTFFLDGISSHRENRKKILDEKLLHIKESLPLYYSLVDDWYQSKDELYKIKSSKSITYLKKIGLLKWLK